MSTVQWLPETERFLIVDASETLGSVLGMAQEDNYEWIVITRQNGEYLYAYRMDELIAYLYHSPELEQISAEDALHLQEDWVSQAVPTHDRPTEVSGGEDQLLFQPSMVRFVAIDDTRTPVSIGELVHYPGIQTEMFQQFQIPMTSATPPWVDDAGWEDLDDEGEEAAPDLVEDGGLDSEDEAMSADGDGDAPIDLGRRRGGTSPRTGHAAPSPGSVSPPPAKLDVIISAECPEELQVDREGFLSIRLELESGATPLRHALPSVRITDREDVDAILNVDPSKLEVVGAQRRHLAPPTAEVASSDVFVLRGKLAGKTEASVTFYQGSTELGSLVFSISVVTTPAQAGQASASAQANPRNTADDEALSLVIIESSGGSQRRLTFLMSFDPLVLHMSPFESLPLEDAAPPHSPMLHFARTTYRKIDSQVLEKMSDLAISEMNMQGIGVSLSEQLIPDDLIRKLWPHRDSIKVVQVTSFEPHIPWELVRFRHPDTREVDDRYLAEYGLVRRFGGNSGETNLKATNWSLLVGDYPNNPEWQLGGEVQALEADLSSRGVSISRIPSVPQEIYNALRDPEFDVLYVACHGKTDLDDIDNTTLTISDRVLQDGMVAPVDIDATTVNGLANLQKRRPIVFLNACETAQQTTSLTDWGGWPSTFWRAGAGAFIGTSWSVREKPAIAFANALHAALFDGNTLADAVRIARKRAREEGGSYWLAYVVYGSPSARLQGVGQVN